MVNLTGNVFFSFATTNCVGKTGRGRIRIFRAPRHGFLTHVTGSFTLTSVLRVALPCALLSCCNATDERPHLAMGGSSAGSGAGTAPPHPEPVPACPEQALPRTPLRRLTRFEYQNAARDVLGVDASAAADLPADEVTNGFDNNAAVLTVSDLHVEKYVLVAEALAKTAVTNPRQLTGCDEAGQGEEACAHAFAQRLARRAFRRAATSEDEVALMAAYAAGRTGGSYAEGLELMVRAALQSPSFLYRLELSSATDQRARVPLDAYELATRLSFSIWSSGPDDALLDAAARGELSTREQVGERARAMLMDARASGAIAHFFEQWTGVARLAVTSKSASLLPNFSNGVKQAMAAELPAFVQHVLWDGDASLRSLLTSPVAFVNADLAPLYGVTAPATPTFVDLPAAQRRAGLLTQAGFLAVQGHPDQTSPVLRGKFVRAMLLCQPPPPPPPDVDISLPPLTDGATARSRLASHLAAGSSCNGCHALMDPIGLAFESFDAVGRFRTTDGNTTLDTSGEISGVDDAALQGRFADTRELAEKLAESATVRACLSRQWFRFASGRTEVDADSCSLDAMSQDFADGNVLSLIVASTQQDTFWFRSPIVP